MSKYKKNTYATFRETCVVKINVQMVNTILNVSFPALLWGNVLTDVRKLQHLITFPCESDEERVNYCEVWDKRNTND